MAKFRIIPKAFESPEIEAKDAETALAKFLQNLPDCFTAVPCQKDWASGTELKPGEHAFRFAFHYHNPAFWYRQYDSVIVTADNYQLARAKAIAEIRDRIKETDYSVFEAIDETGEKYPIY